MAIDCDFLAEPVNTFLGCCIPRNRWVRIWLRGPIENVASTSDLIRHLTSGFIVKTDSWRLMLSVYAGMPPKLSNEIQSQDKIGFLLMMIPSSNPTYSMEMYGEWPDYEWFFPLEPPWGVPQLAIQVARRHWRRRHFLRHFSGRRATDGGSLGRSLMIWRNSNMLWLGHLKEGF